MRSEYFDLIPGGGPALAGIHNRKSLFKGGAKEPDPPPPTTAPVRADSPQGNEVARRAARRKGLQDTIASTLTTPTLGQQSQLGPVAGGSMYGGEA